MRTIKYILFALTTILLIGIFAFESPAHEDKFLPTRLRITVLDRLGNPAEAATVSIFTKEADYRESENAVRTGTTDEKGQIKFKDLEPISFFIDARKEDQNNNGEGVKTAPLEEGKLNKVNTIIE